MYKVFAKNAKLRETLWHWWAKLDENRGDRAKLRRAHSIAAVVLCPAYQRLYKQLVEAGWKDEQRYRAKDDYLAAAIGLIAHIDRKNNQDGLSPVKAMGAKDGDRPAVSELRFLRVLESPDAESLFTGLRRLLPLMEKSGFSVMSLVDDVVNWDDGVKKQWAYDYDWPTKA